MASSSFYSQTKSKMIKSRKDGLQSRLDSLKSSYKETFEIFQQRLDDILCGVLSTGDALLKENDDDDVFLKSVNDVEHKIEKCNQEIFDITMAFCLHCTNSPAENVEKLSPVIEQQNFVDDIYPQSISCSTLLTPTKSLECLKTEPEAKPNRVNMQLQSCDILTDFVSLSNTTSTELNCVESNSNVDILAAKYNATKSLENNFNSKSSAISIEELISAESLDYQFLNFESIDSTNSKDVEVLKNKVNNTSIISDSTSFNLSSSNKIEVKSTANTVPYCDNVIISSLSFDNATSSTSESEIGSTNAKSSIDFLLSDRHINKPVTLTNDKSKMIASSGNNHCSVKSTNISDIMPNANKLGDFFTQNFSPDKTDNEELTERMLDMNNDEFSLLNLSSSSENDLSFHVDSDGMIVNTQSNYFAPKINTLKSPTSKNVPELLQSNQHKINKTNKTDKLKSQVKNSMPKKSFDNHLTLLEENNIGTGTTVVALVSDVVDPSLFSIQLEVSKDVKMDLEYEMNEFYSQLQTFSLRYKKPPAIGSICVALYSIDECWYRVKVLKKHKEARKIEVWFIDYGNCGLVNLDQLRIIKDQFLNFPPQAISCFLNGVEPVNRDQDGCWSNKAIKWFDAKVFGNYFTVKFISDKPSYDNQRCCQKFAVDLVSFDNEKWNVCESMVGLNYAKILKKEDNTLTQYCDKNNNILIPKNTAEKVKLSHASLKNRKSITLPKKIRTSRNKSDLNVKIKCDRTPLTSFPAGMERTYHRTSKEYSNKNITYKQPSTPKAITNVSGFSTTSWESERENCEKNLMIRNESGDGLNKTLQPKRRNCKKDFNQNTDKRIQNENKKLTYIEHMERQSNANLELFEAMNCKGWNPMLEDFSSERNNYLVNVDNACVAVEKQDYDDIRVCKFYLRGDCWSGRNCNFSHHNPNSAVIQTTPVLSLWNIPTISLKKNCFVCVKVTTTNHSNKSFYVQILQDLSFTSPSHFNLEDFSYQRGLEALNSDMANYYSQLLSRNPRQANQLITQSSDEIFAVRYNQVYYRVAILFRTPYAKDCKVFFIDYGFTLWKNHNKLLPLHKAFIHLPAQALLCNLSQTSTFKPEKQGVYIAMISNGCEIVDSPFRISLMQKLNKAQ